MKLQTPRRKKVVLDTDAFSEVDDLFAIAHLLLSPDVIEVEALYAAPYLNHRSESPEDGMEKSYKEILRVLDLVRLASYPRVIRGSARFLTHAKDIVNSEAAADLVERANRATEDKLFVLAIGAPTNIASALRMEPAIAKNIVVVWLGGHAPGWPDTNEFNLIQDIEASRTLLESNVPLILIPCQPVSSHLVTTVAELQTHLAPLGELGAFLTNRVREYLGNQLGWSKALWDMAVSGWVIEPSWLPSDVRTCPVLRDNFTWDLPKNGGRMIRIAREVDRDAIFRDFYTKVGNHAWVRSHEYLPARLRRWEVASCFS